MTPLRVVLFDQMFSGPTRSRDDAQAALRDAGFDVRTVDCPYGDDTPACEVDTDDEGRPVFEPEADRVDRIRAEQAQAWLVAERVSSQPPSDEDQAALMERAAGAAGRYGYTLRQHGVGWTWREGGA